MPRNPAQAAYASDLEKDLRRCVRGEVRFDAGSRALYSTDASNYRQVPIGVVIPKDTDDVVEAVALARRYGAPILARGGGTSLAGQCCNVALVLDMSKYMRSLLELDPQKRLAVVQPGLVLDDLRHAAQKHGLTFAADPATHNHCTLGGMIGNNSCGVHSLMAGRTIDNVEELEILTYDGVRMRVGKPNNSEVDDIIHARGRRGEIYAGLRRIRDKYADLIRTRYPKIPRRVSGYSLDQLLPENDFHVARSIVGTESTCVLILEAKVRLVHWPPVRSLLVLGYEDIFTAADQIPEILPHQPIGLEGIDETLVKAMKKKKLHPENLRLLPEGKGWLLVEFGGESEEDADAKAERLMHDLRSIAKRVSGMSSERKIPKFASKSFTRIRGGSHTRAGDVILWPDTFNNYYHPEVLHAAFNSLRRLGYDVQVPQRSLRCGRPLYDFGFLSTAKNLLIEILETLRDDIRSGKPVIVLEPSCASVFRDEMMNLLPENSDAKRLRQQTFLLSEFLQKQAAETVLPRLPHKALVHGHCHHKAIFGMDDEEKVLQRLGLDYEILDSGCCGMAGAFGFEKEHYDVSLRAGERVLLPRVREATADTLIITDGFSCREQIAQTTSRRARHLAEIVDMAFKVGIKDHRVGPQRPHRAA